MIFTGYIAHQQCQSTEGKNESTYKLELLMLLCSITLHNTQRRFCHSTQAASRPTSHLRRCYKEISGQTLSRHTVRAL